MKARYLLLICLWLFQGSLSYAQNDSTLQEAMVLDVRHFDPEKLESYRSKVDFDYEQEIENPNVLVLWWQSLKRKFLDLLTRSDEMGSGWLLLITAVVFIVIVWLILRSTGAIWARGDKSTEGEVRIFNERVDPMSLEAKRDSSLAERDYRSAIRWSYIHLLTILDNHGLLKVTGPKTNRDYLREVSKLNLYPDFGQCASIYEEAWYGDHLVDLDGWQRFAGLVDSVQSKAQSS